MLEPGETPPAGYYGPIGTSYPGPPPMANGIGSFPTDPDAMDYGQRLFSTMAVEHSHRIEIDDGKWTAYQTRADVVAAVRGILVGRQAFTPDIDIRHGRHGFGVKVALFYGGDPEAVGVRLRVKHGDTYETSYYQHEAPGERLRWDCVQSPTCHGDIDWASWEVVARYVAAFRDTQPPRFIGSDAPSIDYERTWAS